MCVLITGAAGFIGSHLVDAVLARGWSATGLDLRTRAATNWDRVAGQIEMVRGDIMDRRTVEGLVAHGVDMVLHLAAESHVDASLSHPAEAMQVNAVGTQIVGSVCAEFDVPMLYTSTDEVYGDVAGTEWETLGADEHAAPLLPSSPYSAGKAAGEMAIRALCRSFGLRAAITRACNGWGARQYVEKLVPIACRCIHAGRPVPLHGGGEQVRQWIAVEEMAQGILHVADVLTRSGAGSAGPSVYNLAGPSRLTVRELVEQIAQVAHSGLSQLARATYSPLDPAWKATADRPGQDRAYHVSGAALADATGWQATRRIDDRESLEELLSHYAGSGRVHLAPHAHVEASP